MRGGMGSSGRSLADRTGSSERRRHCWVLTDDTDHACPGLVVAWRREGGDWWARVVYLRGDASETMVTTWLPGDRLRPVSGAS